MAISDVIHFLLTGFTKKTRAKMAQVETRYCGWVIAIATIIGLFFLKLEYDTLQFAAQSISWPKAKGIITQSSVESSKNGNDIVCTANIQYDYKVDGKLYHSSQISLAGWANRRVIEKEHYITLVNRFPKGTTVSVFYNVSNPAQSVIQPGVVAESVFSPGLLTLVMSWLGGGLIWLVAWCSQSVDYDMKNYSMNTAWVILLVIITGSALTITLATCRTKAFVQMVIPKEALTAE